MREVFSLDAVAEPERLNYWSTITRQVFWPFRMSIPLPSLAGASVTRSVSSVVELATVTAGAHTLAHSAADAASSPGDTLCLALQLSGASAVRQDRRSCTLRAGEALFFDPHRPYSMSFDDMFTLAVFSFPRELLPAASAHVEAITARVISAGGGPVVDDVSGGAGSPSAARARDDEGLAEAGSSSSSGIGDDDGRAVGASSSTAGIMDDGGTAGSSSIAGVRDDGAGPRPTVVASALAYFSCLAATFDSDGMIADSFSGGALAIADTLAAELLQPSGASPEPLLDKAIGYIDLHLSDPALSPQDVANACHVSLRQLYRVFEPGGRTVAELIRRRRLDRAESLLRSLPPHTPVQWIGGRVGFGSVEQFTRAFRRAYGAPPATWRDAERARISRA